MCRDVIQASSPPRAEPKRVAAQPSYSLGPKYEYPEVLPPYVPPSARIPKKAYQESESPSSSSSEQADDEFLGQFTSNHEFLCSSNQIK